MEKQTIIIGNDHGGYALKVALVTHLQEQGYDVEDIGCHSEAIVRYPYYAAQVATAVASGEADSTSARRGPSSQSAPADRLARRGPSSRGILICSTGIGMSIIANKFRGIRAALCYSTYQARMTSAHNKSNILCLGGRCIGIFEAIDMVNAWLQTPYEGGRHDISLGLIDEAEAANFSELTWTPEVPTPSE